MDKERETNIIAAISDFMARRQKKRSLPLSQADRVRRQIKAYKVFGDINRWEEVDIQ